LGFRRGVAAPSLKQPSYLAGTFLGKTIRLVDRKDEGYYLSVKVILLGQ
jgi:hypothetical protein